MSSYATPGTDVAIALWRRADIRRLLIIALVAIIGYAVLNLSTMPVYLRLDRGYPVGTIGIVIGAFVLSEALFKGPMGALADRFGRKRLMVLGPSISIFTTIATVFVPHDAGALETGILIILRVLDGLGAAMLWPAAFALIGESVGDGEKQEAMSLLNLSYLVGIALALPIGGLANDLIGPYLEPFTGARSASLYLAAFLFAFVTVASYLVLPTGREMRASAKKRSDRHGSMWVRGEIRQMLRTARQIPQFLLLGGVTFMAIGFPLVIIKLFSKDQFHLTETQFGMLVLPTVLSMAVLSVPIGRLGRQIGPVRAVHLGLALCAFGMVLISLGAFSPTFRAAWVFVLGGVPVGVGFLLTIPAWYASVSEVNPQRRAANIGAVMTAQGIGAIIGAQIGSQLYQRVPEYDSLLGFPIDRSFGLYSPFLGCALCVAVSWLLSLRVLRR